MVTNNNKDELDPISFWILLLLSGGQQFTFHDLVRIMNRTNESVWEALQILQSRHYAKNTHAKFMIDYAGVEYLTKRGILAGEAEDEPKAKNFKRGFKPPFFFSSWADMFIWFVTPFLLTFSVVIFSSKVTDGYNFISTDKTTIQTLIWGVYVLLVGLYIWHSYHHILENERMVVFFNGKAVAKKGPGHILLLPIFYSPKRVDLRERSQVITKEPCLTRDNMLVNIGFYITWEITDPIASITKALKLEEAMSQLSVAVLRATIAEFNLDEALERRRALNTLIQTRIQHRAEDWGVQVNTTEIRELEPPNEILRQIENRFNATLERDAELERSNAKVRSLRDFLTIGEGMARNPVAQNLVFLDLLEKVNNIISDNKSKNQRASEEVKLKPVKEFLNKNPDFDLLHLEVMAPSFMSVRDFLKRKSDLLISIDLIYSIFAILYFGNQESKSGLLDYLKNYDASNGADKLESQSIYSFLYLSQIDNLMIASSSYGSPLAEDLLGIGSAIGHVKELIKDISYRGKFEKEQSKIALEKLQVDKMQSEATLTKMQIENKQALLEIEKMELENKQRKIELIEKQLTLYEKVKNQKISRKERELFASALLIPVIQIAESEINPMSLSLELDHKKLLAEQNDEDGEKKLLDENTKRN